MTSEVKFAERSADVRGAGTRDEPLRMSAWEANIGKIPLILAQFYPWSQFSSFSVCVLQKLFPYGMTVSRNAGMS